MATVVTEELARLSISSATNERQKFRYAKYTDRMKTEKPYTIISDIPDVEDEQKSNMEFEEGPEEVVVDIRGREQMFSLDKHGFQIVNNVDQCPDVDMSSSKGIETYQRAMEKLIKQNVTGADKVLFFDHRIRLNHVKPGSESIDINDWARPLPPAGIVHIGSSEEMSARGTLKRVRGLEGEDTERLLRGRTRIINVWRPYEHSVEDAPLAFCDGSTYSDEDCLFADHITRAYVGETVYPMYNKAAQWYYLSKQTPQEATLLKIYDSDDSVRAKWTPHVGFQHRNPPSNALPRKSVEVRALVFTYPEDEQE